MTDGLSRRESGIGFLERLLLRYARDFPLRKGKLRIVDALWAAAVGPLDTARLATLRYGGFKLACDLQEDLQRQFYFFGTYFREERMLDRWTRAAKGSKVIFDVGANLGIYSFAGLDAAPQATVHAFEPTPEIARQLREAAQLNGLSNLNVHQVAVSSRNGPAKLNRWRGEFGSNGGMNYVFGEAAENDPARITTVRLDDFCDEYGIKYVDLLKADVQGHEYEVFKGAERLIRAGRIGLIFFELSWAEDSPDKCPARQSIRLLEQYGYQFSSPAEFQWKQSGGWMRGLSDVVARRA
jgi:FkbM family methyltransferase